MMKAMPRVMPIMPSVAMNGGSFALTIRTEVRRPDNTPTERPAPMLGTSAQSWTTK